MTRYFEVTAREDSARRGRLLALDNRETPTVLPPGGDGLFKHEQEGNGTYFLQRRYPLPQATHRELLEAFDPETTEPDITGIPSARLVYPNDGTLAPPADVYVLSDAHGLFHDSRRLVDVITHWREELPPDTALYLPAVATPQNAPLLVYAGADVLDSTVPVLRAYQGIYMHPLGEWQLDSMRALPCACRHCADTSLEDLLGSREKERRTFLENHNLATLEAQVRLASELINRDGLRNALESMAMSDPLLAGALRHLDRHPEYLERRASSQKSGNVLSCGQDSLNRPEVRLYRERLISRVTIPSRVIVLLPCSARKPYSNSSSHRRFRRILGALPHDAREVIVSSPLGAVPRELEAAWPCAHYDAATTGYWDAEEISITAGVLKAYLEKTRPAEVVASLSGGYLKTAQSATEGTDMRISYVSLEELAEAVQAAIESSGIQQPGAVMPNPAMDAIRYTADYQFGAGAGDALCAEARITFRQRICELTCSGLKLASLSPRSGLLRLTMEGANRLENLDHPTVRIDDFAPTGSVLAPGVMDASPEIRNGDEVIFQGPRARGVGRARMAGWEMKRAIRGVAVHVREVEELK